MISLHALLCVPRDEHFFMVDTLQKMIIAVVQLHRVLIICPQGNFYFLKNKAQNVYHHTYAYAYQRLFMSIEINLVEAPNGVSLIYKCCSISSFFILAVNDVVKRYDGFYCLLKIIKLKNETPMYFYS